MHKPSKPWRVIKMTSRGVLPGTPFRSQRAAYSAVGIGCEGAEKGVTDMVGAIVEQWEDGRWRLFERIAYPQHPDRLAWRYKTALEDHTERPDMPGAYEAMQSAWDAMVEDVESAGHEVDTCDCPSCTLYRAGTKE